MKNFDEIMIDCTKHGRKIKKGDYLDEGEYPIIDQGQQQCIGYSNEVEGLFTDVPAIIFGDHTRIVKYIDEPFYLGADGVKVLRSKNSNADYRYLYYAIRNVRIENTGYNRHFKWLKESKLRYPELKQQQEIASILWKVERIIELKEKELEELDKLIKSLFIEMFGDPVHNPLGWDVKPLLECGDCKNGMNFSANESGIELKYLGVGDFQNISVIDDVMYLGNVSLNKMPKDDYILKDGDIVFVRSNGNNKLVGRCLAVYPKGILTTFSGFCIRYRNTDESIEIPYLLQVLKTDSMRLNMVGRGANIQNLNQKILAELMIPVPPNKLQTQFAQFIQQIDKLKFEVQNSLDETQLLFDSLMQKYFE